MSMTDRLNALGKESQQMRKESQQMRKVLLLKKSVAIETLAGIVFHPYQVNRPV